MIEFWIADLESDELHFSVPGTVGVWNFSRRDDYADILNKKQRGQCASTFYASNEAVTHRSGDEDFLLALDDLKDSCLILSFINGTCVTPVGTTPQSFCSFIQLGDSFITPRAIEGFRRLNISQTLSSYFSIGMPSLGSPFKERQMRNFLSHWISGITCHSMEDLFLSIGVQMDIVKQCEISAINANLDYFNGMNEASKRYSIAPLTRNFVKMRNDIIHEGVLSGSNFKNKTKLDCAQEISRSLDWIDAYVCKVLSIDFDDSISRWDAREIESGLPARTLYT